MHPCHPCQTASQSDCLRSEADRKCSQRKQAERSTRIANLPSPYVGPYTSTDRDILAKPISELVQAVHSSDVQPTSILRAYGKAAIKAHIKTNCLTEIMLSEAESWVQNESNLKGPLAGIPVSLKDSVAVRGFDVSVGYSSNCFKPYTVDGPMVRVLKAAGAVPYVKTALPITLLSFESTNDVWGRCTNPHNPNYSPGGSSGGEGALLAAGGGRIGIGSDVAGSVRAPAHFSGIYSLRCSTGRWPKMGNNTSMPGQEGVASVFSPMGRTLPDLAYFTKSLIQTAPWDFDHTVHRMPWSDSTVAEAKDKQVLRVGVMRTDGVVDPSPACARALERTVSALRAEGHECIDIDLTTSGIPSPYEGLVIASQLLLADGTGTFRSFFRTGETDDPGAAVMRRYMDLPRWAKYLYYLYVNYVRGDHIWAGLLRHWYPKTAEEQWTSVAKREAYRARWFDWWREESQGFDFILTPPNATPAVPHDGMGDAVSSCGYTFLWNLLDYTAGIIPVTKVDKATDALSKDFKLSRLNGVARGAMKLYDAGKMHGLPVAIQVVGRRLEEEKVLVFMERIEGALEKHGGTYELMSIDEVD